MKVKALIDCEGIGYKFKADEVDDLSQSIGEKLVKFGYVEEIVTEDNGSGNSKEQQPPVNENTQLTVDDLPHKSGWYELPNGEKVQGKENAEEALVELYKEKSEE